MSDFSKEQLVKALEFYKMLGLTKNKILEGGEVLDLYRVLGAKPEFDENGKRHLTPYEILGVPPQIVNGEEVPIVFAIKNKTAKIGKYAGEQTNFVYKEGKVKDKDSLLETLKQQYKQAVLMGNDAEAEKFLDLIDSVTGGGAEEFLDSFYDYTKFYRRMKKQLLIDIFAHFFIMFMRTHSLLIKKGIIKKGKIYKAYRENEIEKEEDYVQDVSAILGDAQMPNLPNIKSVTFDVSGDDFDAPVSKKTSAVVQSQSQAKVDVPPVYDAGSAESVKEDKKEEEPMKIVKPFGLHKEFEELGDVLTDAEGHVFLQGVNDYVYEQPIGDGLEIQEPVVEPEIVEQKIDDKQKIENENVKKGIIYE